ncbi:TolC family protein [Herbaspirillum robiniae]|uniref:Uncharacterized protein n=1 Tax=Herbaspirillum robiniae TaxID=2014887 RepID=A0A246WTR3_9BURK|nr:TolC family protein [Herbaspirillum robiniae]OWY30385.1 hypothetical protein CEJ42_05375 [Herbaspirillum robiniae]
MTTTENEKMSRQALANVLKAHEDTSATLKELTASAQALAAAREALAHTHTRMKAGDARFGELLQSQSGVISAQHRRARAVAQWRAARSRLQASTGQLALPEILELIASVAEPSLADDEGSP